MNENTLTEELKSRIVLALSTFEFYLMEYGANETDELGNPMDSLEELKALQEEVSKIDVKLV